LKTVLVDVEDPNLKVKPFLLFRTVSVDVYEVLFAGRARTNSSASLSSQFYLSTMRRSPSTGTSASSFSSSLLTHPFVFST
jgi:hypothetical protein